MRHSPLSPTTVALHVSHSHSRDSSRVQMDKCWLQRPLKPTFLPLTARNVRAGRIERAGAPPRWGQKTLQAGRRQWRRPVGAGRRCLNSSRLVSSEGWPQESRRPGRLDEGEPPLLLRIRVLSPRSDAALSSLACSRASLRVDPRCQWLHPCIVARLTASLKPLQTLLIACVVRAGRV